MTLSPRRLTEIVFELPMAAHVTLRIYDIGGRLVRTLVEGKLHPDLHHVHWDGHNDLGNAVVSGVYWYRLETGDRTLSRKLVVAR